jgi:hypothetical protein
MHGGRNELAKNGMNESMVMRAILRQKLCDPSRKLELREEAKLIIGDLTHLDAIALVPIFTRLFGERFAEIKALCRIAR